MVTSVIGKIFLNAYNEKYNTHYDAKTFFVEVYYPLFFDHQKYMMTGGNSPLENPKLSWDAMLKGQKSYETPERRKERFDLLMNKIDTSVADLSIAVGYASTDILASTSGQTTNLDCQISKDEIYLSWIGAGLGVGVQGGLSILFDNGAVLLDIFEGWNIYRELLETTPNLKGNQINTWNGQWLAHRYDRRSFNRRNPMADFSPLTTKDGVMSVDIQSWMSVLIGLAKTFNSVQMIGYIYNIGQTNTTVGFIPFRLDQIRKPFELYLQFFGTETAEKANALYGTAMGFAKACRMGAVGIQAMEPKGLRDYISNKKFPKLKNDDENQIINFNTYQIWILAMLNNNDLWDKSQLFAAELMKLGLSDKNAKNTNKRKVEEVVSSTNKKVFIEGLTLLMPLSENKEILIDMASVVNVMPTDNVPYFLTLLRFHYAAIEK